MQSKYFFMPFSSSVEASPGSEPSDASDEIELVDDVEGLELDEPDDAVFDDDADGPAEAPTRAALLRSRIREAVALMHAEEAKESQALASFADAVQGKKVDAEARLAVRDARGEANKPLDRREGRTALAIATGLGPWPEPRRRKPQEARITNWAAFALDREPHGDPCKCKARYERRTKEQLIREISTLRATRIPEEMLWSNYTRTGLTALLCGFLCQEVGKNAGDRNGPSDASPEHAIKRATRKGSGRV